MKFIILFLISFSAVAGFPPTTLKGQSQSTATTTFNFQVPNNQATKTATGTLVETGSQNLLSNPGFEHSTVGTDWNVTSGTLTASGSAPFGSFSGTFSGSIANGNIQSLTGSGTAQAGLNCLVSAFVKTASSNVQLCAIHNGTLNTNLCVNVNSNNTWAQYQIPTVCDAVSTVARIRITTSVSTTFDADNVYVGVNPNFGSVAQVQVVGQSYIAATASCYWDRNSATLGAFGTNASCPGPTITSQKLGSWATTDTDLPRQTITNLQPGTYEICISGAAGTSGGQQLAIAVDGAAINAGSYYDADSGGGTVAGFFKTCGFKDVTSGSMQIDLWGSGNTLIRVGNSGNSANESGQTIFTVKYYPSSSSIVTTNNQDYDWTAYTPTFTGFGTPTGIAFYHKRQGSDLLIRGQFVAGTSTAVEGRVSLPTGLTSSSSMATLEYAGHLVYNGTGSAVFDVLIEPSVSYVTFGFQAATNAGFVKRTGSQLFASGQGGSFFARIPIQGWNNNNVIVGTFAGVGQSTGFNKSYNVSIFRFTGATDYSNCTAGTCTVREVIGETPTVTWNTTGDYTITFSSTFSPTAKVRCSGAGASAATTTLFVGAKSSVSPTSTTYPLVTYSGSGFNNSWADVTCIGY